jgi:hypothetical protein
MRRIAADTYAMSDNFHQSVNGGTGGNHIMLGHGDAICFSDGNGHPETPLHDVTVTTNPAGLSILKFIERNWRLPPVTRRSRDNFPNPVQLPGSYAPVNTPALDDLFDFFDFQSRQRFF